MIHTSLHFAYIGTLNQEFVISFVSQKKSGIRNCNNFCFKHIWGIITTMVPGRLTFVSVTILDPTRVTHQSHLNITCVSQRNHSQNQIGKLHENHPTKNSRIDSLGCLTPTHTKLVCIDLHNCRRRSLIVNV